MKARTSATIEDLYEVQGKAELFDGEIVHMSATDGIPGWAGDQIRDSLAEHARQTRAGVAVSDNKAFILDPTQRTILSPDAAFYIGKPRLGFYVGAPIFAVEKRSESDYGPSAERAMSAKRAMYFAAGTLVVWDVDVLRDGIVRVYRATEPDNPTVYHTGEIAEAEPAVPGWKMPVDQLFYKEDDIAE